MEKLLSLIAITRLFIQLLGRSTSFDRDQRLDKCVVFQRSVNFDRCVTFDVNITFLALVSLADIANGSSTFEKTFIFHQLGFDVI